MQDIQKIELYKIIKSAVSEAIREERINLYFSMLPYAADDENAELENIVTTADSDNDYIDISDMFADESNN